jgi:glutamate-1-semialdehyde 2,1-aminomutase
MIQSDTFSLYNGMTLWDKAQSLIPGGNMLLSKNKNIYSPGLWPCYYSKAKGPRVWDLDGNSYMDFSTNGVGACSLGYACDNIDKKAVDAINNGVMSTLNTPYEVELAQLLVNLHSWADMARFARTGGEANAIAVRIARTFTGREKVAICGYHGWHDWYLAANLGNKDGLNEHLLEGLGSKGVPNNLSGTIIPFRFNNFDDLQVLTEVDDLAAVKMEVARSCEPLPGFLEAVRKICDQKNIVLIFDECTSGFRECYGGLHLKYSVHPDMCMLGKALGNGYAITAVIGKKDLMLSACDTFISSTFWTEAVGPAASIATLEEMKAKRSWEILPVIGAAVKSIWKDASLNSGIPIQISGINALPTFSFLTGSPLGFKTAFTELMLHQGFLASTAFYPTTSHTDEHLNMYKEAVNLVFDRLSVIYHSDADVFSLCQDGFCRPTFKRLN